VTSDAPVVLRYQRALDQFRREGRELPLLKRMSELISLLDLSTTLSSGLSNEEILEAALLIIMGELQASRGVLLVRGEDTSLVVRASRGLPASAPQRVPGFAVDGERPLGAESAEARDAIAAFGLEILCPVGRRGRVTALLGLGPRAGGEPYGAEEADFLRSVAACAAVPIESGLMTGELRHLNQRLSVKVFQLNNLFDISRELTTSFDESAIQGLVTATLMGHLMASRCALYLRGSEGFALAHSRGLGRNEETFVPAEAAEAVVSDLKGATLVEDLPPSPLRARLAAARMGLVVPLALSGRVEGFLAVGERASGAPYSGEDRDFVMTLARQAQAALESVRLHRVELEKQRQDGEMQIAREIQLSLFPKTFPDVVGFEIAARTEACYEVGGDHYDVIPLSNGRVALAVADVSGKGAPASLLMASVHAWLRALAGTETPRDLAAKLNRFLFENTQANRYVTMFYGELDAEKGRLLYVNAGHVPPYLRRRDGRRCRLEDGGPVLGLLEDADFAEGEALLGPGDLVTLVTDGVTEAASESDEEFGDPRCWEALDARAAARASEVVDGLASAVGVWAGVGRPSDDLTIVVLKALER
jgi:sigma-B regulation protein RsbU (phosphoserine phosphatase)